MSIREALLEKYGEIAYNAYCETRDWKSYNGDPLPKWPDVREDIKHGWKKATSKVIGAYVTDFE